MTTAALLAHRFVVDHLRNPVNLLVLVAVPVAFVLVAAGPLAAAGEALGTGGVSIDGITAGWAAGFIAAVGMYFQVASARLSDRRLVLAGLPRSVLVAGRLTSGAVLAALATGSALAALAARTGLDQPARVVAGTTLFAVIYLALGAVVGAVVTNPVNGTMLLLFVWILDVFFGPAMTGADATALRVLPTHFVTLWTMSTDPGHGGPEPLAWALAWALGALLVAYAAVLRTSSGRRRRARSRSTAMTQLTTGLAMAWRSWRRTPVLWALLVAVPVVFVWLADAVTPSGSAPVRLREDGVEVVAMIDPAHMHAGTMRRSPSAPSPRSPGSSSVSKGAGRTSGSSSPARGAASCSRPGSGLHSQPAAWPSVPHWLSRPRSSTRTSGFRTRSGTP